MWIEQHPTITALTTASTKEGIGGTLKSKKPNGLHDFASWGISRYILTISLVSNIINHFSIRIYSYFCHLNLLCRIYFFTKTFKIYRSSLKVVNICSIVIVSVYMYKSGYVTLTAFNGFSKKSCLSTKCF